MSGPLYDLNPNFPWFRSTWSASYMIFTHLADHVRSVLPTDLSFHVAVLDFTRVEIVLVILVIADTTLALHWLSSAKTFD